MKQLLFFMTIVLCTSCAINNKTLTSSTPASEITELGYFEPISYIQLINKGNKTEFCDSLSMITSQKVDSILTVNKTIFRLSKKVNLTSDTTKEKVENELAYMVSLINQKKNLDNIPLTPTIDSIMKSEKQHFSLAIVASGFARKKGNYGGQIAKGIGIGILTLGMFTPIPFKSNLTLHAFIFDSEKNEIAFYKRTNPVEKEPTNSEVIAKQIAKLFDNYFNNEISK